MKKLLPLLILLTACEKDGYVHITSQTRIANQPTQTAQDAQGNRYLLQPVGFLYRYQAKWHGTNIPLGEAVVWHDTNMIRIQTVTNTILQTNIVRQTNFFKAEVE